MRLSLSIPVFVLLSALPMQGFWASKTKHWSIEDFISKKCYEVDNESDQQRCIAVKEFLLEARKRDLEQRYLKVEATFISVFGGVVGLVGGFVWGIIRDDVDDAAHGMIGGLCLGLCAGPGHYMLAKNELEKTIPRSLAFYAKCLKDKGLINRTPREVLDKLEYVVPDLSPEAKMKLKDNIVEAWAAKEIAD